MHHGMVVHSYYPYDETRVQRQAEALVARHNQVDVICLRKGSEPVVEVVDGVAVYRLPVQRDKRRGMVGQMLEYLAFMVLAFFKLTQLHVRLRYDVVQVHNLPDFLVFAAMIPRLTGSKIILDLHDLMPEFYCAKFNTSMASLPVRMVAWQERAACRFAHHVITVTESWRQTLIQRGVPAEKCSVVMNLADTRYFTASTAPAALAGGLRLIYHGNITRRYGLDILLRALALARESIPGLHLTIQGRGDYLDEIRALIATLGLETATSIDTEFLSALELGRLIQSHQVGIVPYRRDIFTDGILPTKLLEYTALGLPVIAARTPAITAYFDDSTIELFAPENVDDLAQRIVRLYRDPERRAELARNTSRFNSHYNWPNQRERYTHLVEKLGRDNPVSLTDIAVK